MKNRFRTLVGLVAVSLCVALAAPAQAPRPQEEVTVADLGWISGAWLQKSARSTTEEHWTHPDGGTMLGVSRTISGGKTVFFEFLRIEERPEGIFYIAQPRGRPPVEFKLTRAEGQAVRFENPAHDFPTRILYRKNADGSLAARVEGEQDGKTRGQDFHFQPMKKD